jgi:hypothetical protein
MIRQFIKNIPFLYSSALRVKHWLWYGQTKKAFLQYINGTNLYKLQLGAGANQLPTWFNTDYFARPGIFFLDVTKKFPFPANTFEWVFSEHHIEHITYLQAQFMLSETYKVMKPGGYIKITTPDLQKYIAGYANQSLQLPLVKKHAKDWIYSGFANAATYIPIDEYYEAHFINDIFLNYEHRFIYDAHALTTLLEKAGFINIINHKAGEVLHPEFEAVETHTAKFDRQFTLYIQAQKPF